MVYKCDALRHLVQFVQFKKHKSTYGGVLLLLKLQAFIKVLTLLKVTPLHVRLSLLFSNSTKSHEMSQIEFPQMRSKSILIILMSVSFVMILIKLQCREPEPYY